MAESKATTPKAVRRRQPNISATAPDNVIHPAAFAGKPVVVNPERKSARSTKVIGLRHRRQQRNADAKWKAEAPERAAREAEEREKARAAEIARYSVTLQDLRKLDRVALEAFNGLRPLLDLVTKMSLAYGHLAKAPTDQ